MQEKDIINLREIKGSLKNLPFSTKLKLYRVARKIEIKEVAEFCRITRQTIYNIEEGKCAPQQKVLNLLSSFYGFESVEWFITYINMML